MLLCLDEFEKLQEVVRIAESRAPLNFLRHVMQHRPRWTLLFAGARGVEDIAPLWSDYLIHARALRVSYLDEADARDLILHPVDDFPDVYEPGAVDAVIHWTRCQPYLVQLLCTEIVALLNREDRQRAAATDVDAAIPRAFETGGQYFTEFWRVSATSEERTALLVLARDGELPGETAESVVRALVRREVVEQVGEEWRFQVPLIRRWVGEQTKVG